MSVCLFVRSFVVIYKVLAHKRVFHVSFSRGQGVIAEVIIREARWRWTVNSPSVDVFLSHLIIKQTKWIQVGEIEIFCRYRESGWGRTIRFLLSLIRYTSPYSPNPNVVLIAQK